MSVTLALLSAHLLADFPLQTDDMAANKLNDWRYRTFHVIAHVYLTAAFLLFVASLKATLAACLVIGVFHWVIDSRQWFEDGGLFDLYGLAVDQSLHVASLFVVSVVFL